MAIVVARTRYPLDTRLTGVKTRLPLVPGVGLRGQGPGSRGQAWGQGGTLAISSAALCAAFSATSFARRSSALALATAACEWGGGGFKVWSSVGLQGVGLKPV